jgi:hypothetical protein
LGVILRKKRGDFGGIYKQENTVVYALHGGIVVKFMCLLPGSFSVQFFKEFILILTDWF